MHIHKQLKKGHTRDWEHKGKVVKAGKKLFMEHNAEMIKIIKLNRR